MTSSSAGFDRNIYREIIAWATEGGSPGDITSTEAEVEAHVQGLVDEFADVKLSEGELAASAEARVNQGPFISPFDLLAYLGGGGLLLTDDQGDPVQSQLVKVVQRFDDQLMTDVWDVYIDEEYT